PARRPAAGPPRHRARPGVQPRRPPARDRRRRRRGLRLAGPGPRRRRAPAGRLVGPRPDPTPLPRPRRRPPPPSPPGPPPPPPPRAGRAARQGGRVGVTGAPTRSGSLALTVGRLVTPRSPRVGLRRRLRPRLPTLRPAHPPWPPPTAPQTSRERKDSTGRRNPWTVRGF